MLNTSEMKTIMPIILGFAVAIGVFFSSKGSSMTICFVQAPTGGQTIFNRPCQSPDSQMVSALQETLAGLPPSYRQAAENIETLWIEVDSAYFKGNGYAWFRDFSDVRRPKRAYIRLAYQRLRDVMDGRLSSETLLRQKLTSLFKETISRQELSVETNVNWPQFLLLHEITHIIDISRQLNFVADEDCARRIFGNEFTACECEMSLTSFSRFSWRNSMVESTIGKDTALSQLLPKFYCPDCESSPLTRTELKPLLIGVHERTDFVSVYSTMDPWEDLADFAALTAIQKIQPNAFLRYTVRDPAESETWSHDVFERLKHPDLSAKRKFVDTLILNP